MRDANKKPDHKTQAHAHQDESAKKPIQGLRFLGRQNGRAITYQDGTPTQWLGFPTTKKVENGA